MRTLGMGQAINEALREEMRRDETVLLAGEGVGVGLHGDDPFFPTHGLLEEFGRKRVKDTPVSEAAIAGLAVGAAATGLRPVVEILFLPFITIAMDQIVNHAAKLRYLSGGKSSFPLVVRTMSGAGFAAGTQHSHNLEAWLTHSPGLKVVMPATPMDAKGLLKSAIRDNNPVIFIEDMLLYYAQGEVPDDEYTIPLGQAEVKREGEDITLAVWSKTLGTALAAADTLSQEGISLEVLDLRTLIPLDKRSILESVAKTGRLMIVHEACQTGGFGGEVAAVVADEGFSHLKAPVRRVAGKDVPVPFSPPLERFSIPQEEDIVREARKMMGR